jgi:hypothetical protein
LSTETGRKEQYDDTRQCPERFHTAGSAVGLWVEMLLIMRWQSLQICIVILIGNRWSFVAVNRTVYIAYSDTGYKGHCKQYDNDHHSRAHKKRNPGVHCHQKSTDRHRQSLSHKCCCMKVGESRNSMILVSRSKLPLLSIYLTCFLEMSIQRQ